LAILSGKRGYLGLVADETMGMEDISIIPEEPGAKRMLPSGVVGGSVLSDGSPTLVLDPSVFAKPPRPAPRQRARLGVKPRSVKGKR